MSNTKCKNIQAQISEHNLGIKLLFQHPHWSISDESQIGDLCPYFHFKSQMFCHKVLNFQTEILAFQRISDLTISHNQREWGPFIKQRDEKLRSLNRRLRVDYLNEV